MKQLNYRTCHIQDKNADSIWSWVNGDKHYTVNKALLKKLLSSGTGKSNIQTSRNIAMCVRTDPSEELVTVKCLSLKHISLNIWAEEHCFTWPWLMYLIPPLPIQYSTEQKHFPFLEGKKWKRSKRPTYTSQVLLKWTFNTK